MSLCETKTYVVNSASLSDNESLGIIDTKKLNGPQRALADGINLIARKSADYQNPNSSIKQSDHYRRGIDTIHDMIHQKMMRAQSLLESGVDPSNEALADTYLDMMNYAAIATAWLRGEIDGQEIVRLHTKGERVETVDLETSTYAPGTR